MNVKIAFPMWTENWDAATDARGGKNRGEKATNVIKLTVEIRPAVSDYIGFYVPRMKPFMKSTGGNEVEVATARKSTYCWYYGTEDGSGHVRSNRVDNIGIPAGGST